MNDYPNANPEEAFMADLPEERKKEEQKEEQAIASSTNQSVQDVIDWLDSKIAAFSDFDSVNVTQSMTKNELLAAVFVPKELKKEFEAARSSFVLKFGELIREDPLQ
jgi:hypothetical protein